MACVISVASGKGGVGKSVVSVNLALSLARQGAQVVLADLDVGGADAHVLVGLLNPPLTLTDFLNHRIVYLNDLAQRLSIHPNLRIIPGTGDTLATANMSYSQKKRLIRRHGADHDRYRRPHTGHRSSSPWLSETRRLSLYRSRLSWKTSPGVSRP